MAVLSPLVTEVDWMGRGTPLGSRSENDEPADKGRLDIESDLD